MFLYKRRKNEIYCITSYSKRKTNWNWIKNLTELEKIINEQAEKGYRLHTISTTSSGSSGLLGGDRIQATMVFEKLD